MTVIYIMASSHSGSTLLSFLLGSHPEVFNLGELKEFESFFNPEKENDRGQFNSPCDCGINVYDCPFWSKIQSKSTAKPDSMDLFNQIRKNVKEPILVDNSKVPEKFEFYRDNNIPYKIVHLVRDGRARAYSEQKLGRDYRYAIRKWAKRNIFINERYKNDPNYILIYYEDLAKEPINTLNKIFNMVDLQATEDILNYQDKEFHSIGGNRKVRTKRKKIKFDNEYLNNLTTEQWNYANKQIGNTLRYFGYMEGYYEQMD